MTFDQRRKVYFGSDDSNEEEELWLTWDGGFYWLACYDGAHHLMDSNLEHGTVKIKTPRSEFNIHWPRNRTFLSKPDAVPVRPPLHGQNDENRSQPGLQ